MKLINDKIIEDLFESLGLRFLAKEKQDEIMTRVLELISKSAGIRIIEGFSDQETEEFNKIPKEDLEKMEDFMIAKNAKAKEIFKEEAEKVKKEMLTNIDQKQNPDDMRNEETSQKVEKDIDNMKSDEEFEDEKKREIRKVG